MEDTLDSVRCFSRSLVLPHDHHRPSGGSESAFCVPVARLIRAGLSAPPSAVRLGGRRMLRTAMPEAAPHVDRHACGTEHDVHPATRGARHDRALNSISQTAPVQFPTKRNFGRSVPFSLSWCGCRNRTNLTAASMM